MLQDSEVWRQAKSGWALQRAVLDHLEKAWVEMDEGIWESRSGPRHYTFSKVMAWVAFDRAMKSAEAFKLDGPVEQLAAAVCRDSR